MWIRAEGKIVFASESVPDWVKDWIARRRGPAAVFEKSDRDDETAEKPSIRLASEADTATEADPKGAARSAAARERNREERESSILSGLDDLDVWLADQVERGMAGFIAQSGKACRVIAQRMVDAKAPGIATRLDGIPTRLFTLSEPVRPIAAIQELGQIHLLSEAYRRQNELPQELVADARQSTGWTVTREALLADKSVLRMEGLWRVIATLSEVQPDRLRRIETWLWHESPLSEKPRFAVLIDFVPVATGAANSGYTVGDRIDAELVFYSSACPMRAQIARTSGGAQSSAEALKLPDISLDQAFAVFERAVADLPWLSVWPLAFQRARIRRSGETLFLCDLDCALVLPLHASQSTTALPLTGMAPFDGIALWNGYYLTLCWAQTELGRWVAA
jgi:hypothetical protein